MAPNSPNKRASMREGPLASLFRKTEEGEDAGEAGVDVAAPDAASSPSEAKPRARRREVPAQEEASPAKQAPRERQRELPHPAPECFGV